MYTISVFAEDRLGLLNRILQLFTRRRIHIEHISASESTVKGIFCYTIVANAPLLQVEKLVKQIDRQVDVFKTFYHEQAQFAYHQSMLSAWLKELESQNKITLKQFNNN